MNFPTPEQLDSERTNYDVEAFLKRILEDGTREYDDNGNISRIFLPLGPRGLSATFFNRIHLEIAGKHWQFRQETSPQGATIVLKRIYVR